MMKPVVQLATSLAALAGLLGAVATQAATNIAELPLKASVLAKPNVIWGMDDSGSMDWEVMLDTTEGALWLNTSNTPPTSWDSSGKPINNAGNGTTGYKYNYLFPVGQASGAQSTTCSGYSFTATVGGANYGYCSPTTGWGMAAPPIPEMAALRSAAFNPIYYNTMATYKPWSPAYLNGAQQSYGNATTSAAKASPQFSGSTTLNLSADVAASTTTGYLFYVMNGQRVPVGSRICSNTNIPCTSWGSATTSETTMSNGPKLVGIPYYPATFWQLESCTANNSSSTSNCVTAPGGTGTLKRYEIKSGNSFPSGRSYADEMQNFANWWQYYRKRTHMLAASMGKVIENLTGVRMGVVAFNNRTTVTMYDADATAASANRLAVAGIFYTNPGNSATPTRETLQYIGNQFHTNTNIIQYACQRNAAFIVTDGFANASSPAVTGPAYSQATYGSGAPYTVTSSNSLADIALSYYTTILRGSAFTAGRVPLGSQSVQNPDANTNLHMNTYGIMLGIKGTIWPGITDAWSTPITWPIVTATGDRGAIDDLWHATINGRGKLYSATSPEETAASIQAGLNDILSQTGAQGGIAVSTVNLQRGDGYAYLGRYDPAGWSGDLTANGINGTTGLISTTSSWSADAKLLARDWTTRNIAAFDGSGGVGFTASAVGSTVNPGNAWGTTADVISYLRGDRSKEGTSFRIRTSLMGAVMSSEPAISRDDKVVYVASGEGMLHAFDITVGTDQGKELWAFVPQAVLADIGQTTARAYAFKTQLDGTPVVGSVGGSSKLLVAGMGAAGNAYYALDVSTPRSNTESNASSWVKWQFPGASTSGYASKVGQTLGKPVIVKTTAGYRVLVTSGYNSTADGKGRLFVLDPSNGSVLKEFATTAGTLSSESGLTHVSAYLEDDGTVQYVYGGDLLGNVWRFDLNADSGTAPNLVAVLKGPTGVTQPVTAAPELVQEAGKRVILIGTGRLLDVTDFGSSLVQTFYAIADGSTLSNARSSLTARTYTRSTDSISGSDVNWSTGRGWYMDLSAGEQANTRPSVAYNAVSFSTNVAGASDCSASSWFYVLDIGTGGKSDGADFISQQISPTSNSSEVNSVVTSDGKVVGEMQTYDGEPVSKTVQKMETIKPSKNSWREVRQQ